MSKPETNEYDLAIKFLKMFGYKTTKPRNKNCNGSDLFAIKKDYVFSVEVKRAVQVKSKNVYRVRAVTRINDDIIAIVFPFGYVLIEPMRDHLKVCNKQGDRFINF